MINRSDVQLRLTEAGIAWHLLDLGDGWSVVVSAYGARVYGPFASEHAPSANWLPDAFGDADAFAALVESGFWNVGGERIWIGPEIRYMIPDRSEYWASYTMPAAIDPGVHSLEVDSGVVRMASEARLESFLAPLGSARFTVGVDVARSAHPLRETPGFATRFERVSYAGYTTTVSLVQDGEIAIPSESWILNQVRGGGTALISATPVAEVTDYYEPVGDQLAAVSGGLAVQLSGARRFKIGVKSAHVFGRLGHVSVGSDGLITLMVRSFPNDPSNEYTEEPDFAPGVRGDSTHLYNDDGGLGGFSELESRGGTVGLTAGKTASVDRFSTWLFTGSHHDLDQIAWEMLGIHLPANIRPADATQPTTESLIP